MMEKIVKILQQHTERSGVQITETTNLQKDLGLSSLDMVNIVTDFEEAFGIDISDADIRKLMTVGDILRYLEYRLS